MKVSPHSIGRLALMSMFAFLVFTAQAPAAPILLNSDLVNEDNNFGPNVRITPIGLWAPEGTDYFWISYTDTGAGGIELPNVTGAITLPDPELPTAVFYEYFTLPYGGNTGAVTIWADDTARVYLDNLTLFTSLLLIDANPNLDGSCTPSPIGCEISDGFTVNFGALGLAAGDYRLRIEAYQRDGGQFGVLYRGELESVPEPGTTGLAATGCLLLLILARKFRRPSV